MDPRLEAALRPVPPGRLVRSLRFLPGIGRTASQISDFADHWRAEAERAIRAGAPVLVVLGDSLGQGIGASGPAGGYAGTLRRELGPGPQSLPVLNLSRSGARLADVLDVQLPALAVAEVPVTATVCTVGSNDLVRSAAVRSRNARLGLLLDRLPPGTVMATVPARGSVAAKAFNRRLRGEAVRRGLRLADVDARLTSWRGRRAADGFHPNDVGYQLWVAAFLAAFAEPAEGSGFDRDH